MLCSKNGQSFTLPACLPACLPAVSVLRREIPCQAFFHGAHLFPASARHTEGNTLSIVRHVKIISCFSPFSTHFSQQRVEKLDYKSIFFARKKLPSAKCRR